MCSAPLAHHTPTMHLHFSLQQRTSGLKEAQCLSVSVCVFHPASRLMVAVDNKRFVSVQVQGPRWPAEGWDESQRRNSFLLHLLAAVLGVFGPSAQSRMSAASEATALRSKDGRINTDLTPTSCRETCCVHQILIMLTDRVQIELHTAACGEI